jgi:hypothetical protein
MAIPAANLDDRNFDQLAGEGRALIQRYFPAWTDYNPSDPGITLIELFAYLIEAAIYQINRVPERSLERFAGLVGVTRRPSEPIAQTLGRALASIQQHYRAVTEDDFEALAREVAGVARSKAVVQNLPAPSAAGRFFPGDQLVRVVIVPSDANSTAAQLQALCDQVFVFFGARRLITTKIRVVPPEYTPVNIVATVVRASGSPLDTITIGTNVDQAVRKFLDDRSGGSDGNGWPFGRAVYRSELYRLIEGLDGIDHVSELSLNSSDRWTEIPAVSPLSLVALNQLIVRVL